MLYLITDFDSFKSRNVVNSPSVMDQSYSDGDITLSPSQLLERLQMLRQLQVLQRGKLQKQRLEYQETSENYDTSCITEMISHFTNSNSSTTYNTFRSLLQSPQSNATPRLNASDISQKVKKRDLIDGVSVLNLSNESEFIVSSPASTGAPSNNRVSPKKFSASSMFTKKQLSLDEMPIHSPRKDFEALVIEKLQTEKHVKAKSPTKTTITNIKKQFLKRGEGTARFGVKKTDLVIQNTKSLPWRTKKMKAKPTQSPYRVKPTQMSGNSKSKETLDVEILFTDPKLALKRAVEPKPTDTRVSKEQLANECKKPMSQTSNHETNNNELEHSKKESNKVPDHIIQLPTGKHPTLATKGNTWAAVLTKEQNDFLYKLKQSHYYKNFASPSKSSISDMSCDENVSVMRHEKETAEQKLFELLENKVTNESFNLENSFFNRFLRRSNLECSGESTPLVMQKCLANNPKLMHIFPEIHHRQNSYNESESVSECCSDTCSSVSSCCSCKTIEQATPQKCIRKKAVPKTEEVPNENNDSKHQDDSEINAMKANMAEMNAKLITTSELLKERLCELEDEIETFRKENINLNKMREEVDMERQKLYEEKNSFEQKFNEEKILSEYHLAEEKEKLNKQKQTYERYVREVRGRLNKKEKDEVLSLKQEIANLKDDMRVKDAKSTSTMARLRNQIKIMEKEKAHFQAEVEKLKKENRRIQHSNDITRRLTNMKYLEQINKKLSNMNKESHSDIEISTDTKYKAFEIERQSRTHKKEQAGKNTIRPRAKSVPNLKVTSRYAKYFSQKDALSERNNVTNYEKLNNSDDMMTTELSDDNDSESVSEMPSESEHNHLERIYMDTFRSKTDDPADCINNDFFLRKSNLRDSKSPSISQSSLNRSKSPVSVISHRPINVRSEVDQSSSLRSKSPVSILNNSSRPRSYNDNIRQTWPSNDRTSRSLNDQIIRSNSPSNLSNHSSLKSGTVIPNDAYRDQLSISPEPSKTSLTKTSLTPAVITKSDGSRELRFPNGNVKFISTDGKYTKFVYYNGDVKENFLNEGRIKYYYDETKTYHTTHADGLEVLEFPDGQVEKRYADGSSEVRLPNGSIRYHDPKNEQVREEWRFPDGAALTISASGQQRVTFSNGQVEVHDTDHKRREFPDGTVKLVYMDGTSETRYSSGRVRIKDKHGNLIMDSATR